MGCQNWRFLHLNLAFDSNFANPRRSSAPAQTRDLLSVSLPSTSRWRLFLSRECAGFPMCFHGLPRFSHSPTMLLKAMSLVLKAVVSQKLSLWMCKLGMHWVFSHFGGICASYTASFISQSGGGTCLLETMVSVARARGKAYLALTPRDGEAARFWSRGGFRRMQCGWARWKKRPASRPQLLLALDQASGGRFAQDWVSFFESFVFRVFLCHCLFDWWAVCFCGFGWVGWLGGRACGCVGAAGPTHKRSLKPLSCMQGVVLGVVLGMPRQPAPVPGLQNFLSSNLLKKCRAT